jgi:EAL domain-containing protein (putative c-di-GMP-specific phosphodiesterase class I)
LSAARKILDMVEKPYLVNVNQFVLSARMGIAFFPENGTTVDTLIRHADTALQAAKENQGGFVLYRTDQKQKSGKKIALTSELYQAIANDELTLNFQPKVDFKTAEIYGVETLVRWNHSEYGFVSPEEFIPLAEQTEVIQDLTLWVLKNALEQHRRWSEQGIHLKMAVNLSIKNLMDPSCHCKILKLIDDFNVEPNVLELELTETTMMSDPAAALRKMEQLTERGINFSVDDFGTGYSSLSYLKRLPVKVLKVDKSFLQDIIRDEHDAVIVRATIDLAHNLGLKIVAEGIEDRATWDLLQILRCDMAQGYYVSRPLLAENLVAWMENYDEFKCEHALS